MTDAQHSILRETPDENIVRLVINRPPANALDTDAVRRICTALEEMAALDRPPTIILTAQGERFFCAGGDIREFVDKGADGAIERMRGFHRMLCALESYPAAIVAAVPGYAVGGGFELVLFCDHVVAATHAQFGFPEINNGLLPAAKGMRKAAERIGLRNAEALLYTGKLVDAERARAIGVANQIVPMERLAEEALAAAREYAGKNPVLLKAIKRTLADAARESHAELLERTLSDMRSYLAAPESDEQRRRFLERKRG